MSALDVVAVLGADLKPVFANAQALKVAVSPGSKVMEHPLETGALTTDHRVLLPTTIELSMILASADYKAVYQQIRDTFTRGDLLTVQTRVDSFTSMLIEKIPHEESGDMYEAVAVAISLRKAQFVTAQFVTLKVKRPKDTNTVKRGQQQPTETPASSARKSSVLAEWFK